MIIPRSHYLEQLIAAKHNRMIKIITGLRRCGKSFLLFDLFGAHLLETGVKPSHIIKINLEDRRNASLRDPDTLLAHIDSKITGDDMHYVLLDEVQKVTEFEDVLNSYLKMDNVDVYVTGSNSKFLSTDIITEFRGRGDQIHVYPLSFSEYMSAMTVPAKEAWDSYMTFGGLPLVATMKTDEQKHRYLKEIFTTVYLKDIKERYSILADKELKELVQIAASCIGSPTNPTRLSNTFKSVSKSRLSDKTINTYLSYLTEAFLLEKGERYDIKGKKYIGALAKYYFTDLGVRNAVLNFRQMEETHIMENIIYNELKSRGYSVDVGMVSVRERNGEVMRRQQLEIDFVVNHMSKRYYIQSALSIPDREKMAQESASLLQIPDAFKKIIITKDTAHPWHTEDGILVLGLFDFLLKPELLDY